MSGFRKAKALATKLKLGLLGASGSGKTLSALLFAEGLAKHEGKRIAFIDTEEGTRFYSRPVPERKLHPEAFDFDVIYTRSLTEAAREISKISTGQYGVLVIDSITHFWEAARAAYDGRTTSIGSIPIHAWQKVKKPYKDMLHAAMSADLHLIICGREANAFEDDEETGEMKMVGKKMDAEKSTPYEPDLLLRMDPKRIKTGGYIYRAFGEKDRTGILGGRIIEWPTFDNIIKPLLPLVSGGKHEALPGDEETSIQDATALAEAEAAKQKFSTEKREEFEAMFKLAKSTKALNAVADKLSAEIKKQMLPADVTYLREMFRNREQALSGERTLEPVN